MINRNKARSFSICVPKLFSLILLAAQIVGVTSAYAAGAVFLSSPLAPSVVASAGRFDGSTFFLDVMNDVEANYGSATGLLNSMVSPSLIEGTGSALVYSGGEGAYASMLVWFTLNTIEPFTFTANSSGATSPHF